MARSTARGTFLQLLGVLTALLVAVLLYPYVEERCVYAWEERQLRLFREGLAREREDHLHVDFVVGFYVGPSYSASAAIFRNGSTLNLAKVDGDADYRAAMKRRLDRSETSLAYIYGDRNSDGGGHFGSSTPQEFEKCFIPILRTLKERSEAILHRPIEHVHFATPWIAEWMQPFHDKHDTFVLARRRLGLKEPFVYNTLDKRQMPMHLNEANAVLAAAGRNFCAECFCVPRPMGEYSGTKSDVFYIHLSKTLLFVSRQLGACVFDVYDVHMALDKSLGLEQLHAQDPDQYWVAVKKRVLAFVSQRYQIGTLRTTTILIASDTATNSDLYNVAQSVRKELLELRNSTTFELDNENHDIDRIGPVEILIADDGVYDAAKGAALVMRTDFWDYCEQPELDVRRQTCYNHFEKTGVIWNNLYGPYLHENEEEQDKMDAEARKSNGVSYLLYEFDKI